MGAVDRHPPGLGDLVGVGGADHVEPGDGAQRGELLDRLVGRAVLAEADRVVGEDVDHRQLHQRREADRRPRVVGEGQVGRPERAQLGERQAVGDRRRLVLADAVVELAAVVGAGLEVDRAVDAEADRGRVGEVGGAGEQPRHAGGDRVLDLAGGLARREALLVGLEAGDLGVPAVGQGAPLGRVDLGGEGGLALGVGGELLLPGGARLGAAPADPGGEVLLDPVGDEELGVFGPAVGALGLAHLLLAERLAVRGGGVLLVRRAVADVRVDDDQRRPRLLRLELLEAAAAIRSMSLASSTLMTFQP